MGGHVTGEGGIPATIDNSYILTAAQARALFPSPGRT